jgi:FMN phosphatase YigB (HAD superfamily)
MKAVIFDLGNVLIPYDHHRTVAAVAALCGCDDKRIAAIFHALAEPFGNGRMAPAAFSQEVLRQAGAPPHITEAAFSAAFDAGMGRDPQALAYAVALQGRPNVTVGVISNTNALHVAWLDTHVPELAELDLVMMSNEVELLKPDPEIFELALSLLDVAPEDAIFVDDQPANVAAAAALGIHPLLHYAWDETRPAIEAWLAGQNL